MGTTNTNTSDDTRQPEPDPARIESEPQLSHRISESDIDLSGTSTSTVRAPEDIISLEHHMATWREVVELSGADQAILFDDVINAVDEAQHAVFSGLPGYMRCCLPAAQMAVFVPTHIVTLTPPLPYEIQHSLESLERMGGDASNFHVWYNNPQTGERIDLVDLVIREDWDTYHTLVAYTCENPPEFNHEDYPQQVREIFEETREGYPTTLLLPFQIRELHRVDFAKEISSGEIVTLSPSDLFMSKGKTVHSLIQASPGVAQYFTSPRPVTLRRTAFDPELLNLLTERATNNIEGDSNLSLPLRFEDQQVSLPLSTFVSDDFQPSWNKELRAGITQSIAFLPSAIQYIDACESVERDGLKTYVKLNTSGVSGLDNLSPNTHPEIYNGTRAERIGAMAALLAKRFGEHDDIHLPTGSVEIRVSPGYDHLGKREFSIAGMNLSGRYAPLFFGRSVTSEGDIHEGMLACSDGAKIGMSVDEISRLVRMQQALAEAERLAGYETGELQNDSMIDEDSNRLFTYDFNNRRGGRSYIERVITLHPGTVFFDQDFSFTVPEDTTVHDFAIDLTRKAEANGLHSYGTPIIYYPETDEQGRKHVKLKLVSPVPDELLELCQSEGHTLPELMDNRVRRLLGQEKNLH